MSHQPLIVLGMHRSGTSLAAALLQSAGLDVGSWLLEGNSSNPRGHFEDMEFIELQRRTLARLGLNQDGWLVSELPEIPDDVVARARALVDQKERSGRPWGWKDPRTVLFLSFWSALLPKAAFALVYRAPWEVVESLFKRGDPIVMDDPELAVKLWLHYNQRLLNLAVAAPERCVLANVETITAHPAAWVAALAERSGLPLSTPSSAIYEPTLLHGERARDRAGVISRHYPEVVELFAALERQAFRPAGVEASTAWAAAPTAEAERRLALRDWLSAASAEHVRRPDVIGSGAWSAASSTEREHPGWCSCCRSESQFVTTGPWLRDQYLCARCQSIPRYRAVNLTLDTWFPEWEHATIHEFSPSNDFIRRHSASYSCSRFIAGAPPGAEPDGVRCENIEQLTFADDTFDIFVTQDVLEHAFQPDQAVREIMRVVKPGGAHVFTAPKHKGLRTTRQRARFDDGTVVHLLEAQYHGDPLGDDRQLVTWDYGDDFEIRVSSWCGYPTVSYVVRDRHLGLDGEYLDVFVTRKIST